MGLAIKELSNTLAFNGFSVRNDEHLYSKYDKKSFFGKNYRVAATVYAFCIAHRKNVRRGFVHGILRVKHPPHGMGFGQRRVLLRFHR